jgi:hypothetical protein
MNSLFSQSWLRPWLGVILALGAGGALAPHARGGCDYHVLAPMPADGTSHHAHAAAAKSFPERRPCSGPNCSGVPRSPLIPPAPPVVSGQDWACVPAAEHDMRPGGFSYRLEDSRHTPLIHGSRIFHPPR